MFVPGHRAVTDDHWQKRWQAKLPNTVWVDGHELANGSQRNRLEQVKAAIKQASSPSVIIAHGAGVVATRHAIEEQNVQEIVEKIKGVIFVAPPDLTHDAWQQTGLAHLTDYPSTPMPVPSFVIASRTDPYASHEKSNELASDWGSLFLDAGESGHIDEASGHGPWPEGLMVFAEFMKRL
ncbi:MAG: alpha/beta hydrolase [Pseudomonadota bacterium]